MGVNEIKLKRQAYLILGVENNWGAFFIKMTGGIEENKEGNS